MGRGRPGRRQRADGSFDLEVLDPLTGESLPSEDGDRTDAATAIARRVRRLRALSLVLIILALAAGGAGATFGLAISDLRGIERTWRTAMNIDAARAEADRRVLDRLDEVADADDDAIAGPFAIIGDEAVRKIVSQERSLRDRPILDSKVSALRDQMLEALEFRRFQLTPQRGRMGDTPLQEVELGLRMQLDRWGLDPLEVEATTIVALGPQLARLDRFADAATKTILMSAQGRNLLTIDVDADETRARPLESLPRKLLATAGGVAVLEADLTIYPTDPEVPALAKLPASDAFAAGDGTNDLWVIDGPFLRRVHTAKGGVVEVGDPVELPPSEMQRVVGGSFDHVVLETFRSGRLELWSPATRSVTRELASGAGRFLAADRATVVWQGPLPSGDRRSDGFLHRLQIAAGQRDLIALSRTDAASVAIGPDGTAAVAAGPLAGRLGSILVVPPDQTGLTGTPGPRVAVGPGSLGWSTDGDWLFWLTPEGRIALRRNGAQPSSQLLRTGLGGLTALAVAGR
ncbi:MAG: hypothetical protein M3Q68_04975 [Actinomycetota bacterium]|nr:hypothetical protein [Actinomycetota bacterium]